MSSPIDPGTGLPLGGGPDPRGKEYRKFAAPTSWQAGGGDPIWEQILAAFNEEHQAKYGTPMNRPWTSDQDAKNSYSALLGQYKTKWGELYTEDDKWNPNNPSNRGIPLPPPIPIPPPEGGGGGGGVEVEGVPGSPGQSWSQYQKNVEKLLADFKNPLHAEAVNLAKEQIKYASRRLGDIEQARKLGDMTGTLTSEEKRMFTEMEDSAVSNLKSQVSAQTEKVWNTALSDLVNRGVLQGTVGEKILGTISSENVRTVAEGTNAIRGQTNANMLNVMEGNKNRALQRDQMLSQESLNLLGMGQGYANADLNASLQKLGLGVNSNVQFAGISSQEDIAARNRAMQEALGNLQAATQMGIAQGGWANNLAISQGNWANQLNLANINASTAGQGYQNAWNIANLNAGTQLALGGMQSNAALKGSMYGAAGNVAALGLGILSKYYGSGSGSGSGGSSGSYNWGGNEPSNWNAGYNSSSGNWFWNEP